ncbi:hypothetical protein COO60DRAFT_480434 [Scenedesmus sp. NREL 46B-D3]|nr:hypothetical protein COO60DRAFT_480434 [Scenedesmus sp. NREL 46B-D3]
MAGMKNTRLTAMLLLACTVTAAIPENWSSTRGTGACQTGLWSSTDGLLGVSISPASIRNLLSSRSQACSLHACKISAGAAAESCKLQHVAQLQLQQGALILESKVLLQTLLLDQSSHADTISNATTPNVSQGLQTGAATTHSTNQHGSQQQLKRASPPSYPGEGVPYTPKDTHGTVGAENAAVTLHMAACCTTQHSSGCPRAHTGAAASEEAPAHDTTSGALQDQQQQPQQQQTGHDDQPIWTDTVTLTLLKQRAGQHQGAAGAPPGGQAWTAATPLLLPPAGSHGSTPDAAHGAHVLAGSPAAAANEEDHLLNSSSSSSSNKQLLLVKLHLPADSSTAQQVESNGDNDAAAATQQVGGEAPAAGSLLQLGLGQLGMLMLVLALQVAVYRFATD